MTVESETTDNAPSLPVETKGASMALTRRTVLRGAAVTLPTVLTLHSGAALAFSSNLIGAANGAPKDPSGNHLCLNVSSTAGRGPTGGTYDLGSPAYAEVTKIPSNREYHTDDSLGSPKVQGPQMCAKGGKYYYKKNWGWKEAKVPKGVLLSATAIASFTASGGVHFKDI